MLLLCSIIVFLAVLPIVIRAKSNEYFFENIEGLPLVLLDTMNPLPQMYFKELGHKEFVALVRSASPSSSIENLISKINSMIDTYDPYTPNVPYQLKHTYTNTQGNTRALLYRDGKMYGFLVDYKQSTGIAIPIGFILEQDIIMYKGFDKTTLSRQYQYPVNNNELVNSQEQIDNTIQTQAYAIYQDRGLKASSFS